MQKKTLASLLSGILFGLGLAVSGMMNPQKVLGFLDVFGSWDPTLMLVMGGALLVTLPAFRIVLGSWSSPLLGGSFSLPRKKDLDAPLILGAATFGVGWGISGFCPGPVVAGLATGLPAVWATAGAMLLGMLVYSLLFERLRSD